ncbi:alcohol dehydrogenase zinc-binding domain protein [Dactylonectria macrodidyma]|uniref:Alcohol dehydrogenase zinc-binding domain protein n=1 Tax=Dactylonectria macrodidyma TaxID=307937 RepID=A0A9P9IS56_9HYPO|nr:alcohol dehydrogenase zinc-binding domain protein [Dactylonectria macrodidyma]
MSEAHVYKGSPGERIVRHTLARTSNPLRTAQILVKITHSGICGTDEHYKTQDIVLGHESVVVVEAVGDRVGWGYCHGSCKACSQCEGGKQLYCNLRQLYGSTSTDQGSLASNAIWDADDFLFLIPDSITSAVAAPLICTGAAVYSALSAVQVRWSDRVGVIGIGELEHLVIQFTAKMRCQVVTFSSSLNKQADAMAFGTTEFHCLTPPDGNEMKEHPEPVDYLLLAAAQQPDWNKTIPLAEGLRMPYMELVMNAISIRGSLPAPPRLHQETLRFAASHKVLPLDQTFSFTEDGINNAMEKLRLGKIRYRAVVAREKR